MHVPWARDVGAPKIGVTGSYETSYVGARNQAQALWKNDKYS